MRSSFGELHFLDPLVCLDFGLGCVEIRFCGWRMGDEGQGAYGFAGVKSKACGLRF